MYEWDGAQRGLLRTTFVRRPTHAPTAARSVGAWAAAGTDVVDTAKRHSALALQYLRASLTQKMQPCETETDWARLMKEITPNLHLPKRGTLAAWLPAVANQGISRL